MCREGKRLDFGDGRIWLRPCTLALWGLGKVTYPPRASVSSSI